jgi:hypothetical protein
MNVPVMSLEVCRPLEDLRIVTSGILARVDVLLGGSVSGISKA